MVSIPCNYTAAVCLPKQPLFSKPHASDLYHRAPFHKCRAVPHFVNALGTNSFSFEPREQQQQLKTLFPGGFKRPEIKVPTFVLRLSTEDVLRTDDSTSAISLAVSKGVGIVLLDGRDESGGQLFEAACLLRSVIGDRAYLLIAERVDIATAVGASGVVLSDQGLPAIVARNMMMKSKPDSVFLPLVGRIVETLNSAVSASSTEGADFLIVGTEKEDYAKILGSSVTQEVNLPVFFAVTDSLGEGSPLSVASKLLQSGACGMVMRLDDMTLFSDDVLKKLFSTAHASDRLLKDAYSKPNMPERHGAQNVINGKKGVAGFTKLDHKEIQLIESERLLLQEAITIIRKAAPLMKETSLLVDAVSRLDEPFLLVIVGEFNSGKSTVINALLGRRYLKEGVVPTTNEITLLCYSGIDSSEQERCERHPDGQIIRYLSAPILKEMNLVDTPGTNVILQRQQRLTEEFVPRADLILFVISSDRPLTESEVSFLLYLQQWNKKVVFILNKLDLYRSTSELEEATAFIRENTRKLLNAELVRLYPVSARFALEAKLSASLHTGRNYEELLLDDPHWKTSRFYELEKFLYSFLDGSTDTGMERMRLKLETPIGIADRLLASCERIVKQEYDYANKDLVSVEEAVSSVKGYAMKMGSESILWRKQTLSLIETAKARIIKLIESTLQLSNVDLVVTYALKGERSGPVPATSAVLNEIISPTLSDAQRLLGEYSIWLQSSCAREGQLYMELFDKQSHAFVDLKVQVHSETNGLLGKGEERSIEVMKNFSASAAAKLFEQEIREVVLGTFGGLGAAGLSASLLTSVLPTTLEDLLALASCSAGGLLAISNFPARRKEAIEKVRRVADALARETEEAMQKDLMHVIGKLQEFVENISKPYQDAAQSRINRLLEIQDELTSIGQKLQALKVEIQNLHVS